MKSDLLSTMLDSGVDMSEIWIFGAGSIGCYLGGRLAAAGAKVTFVGRPRVGEELAAHGLRVTDYLGADLRVAASSFRFVTEAPSPMPADLVLVTVKSSGTEEAARALTDALGPGATVVSFQNGIGNAEVLRKHLGGRTVLAGMVPFNVLGFGEGRFHQGTEGQLDVAAHPELAKFVSVFAQAGLPLRQHADMRAVLWAKLLLNLNNPINALSDIPLKEQLSQRAYRACLALAQREGLSIWEAADIEPLPLTPVPPRWIPRLLDTPDWLFRRLGGKMLAIDPLARSSMWSDLKAGRATEVDWINGEVVRLATEMGRKAPVNARLMELVRAAEKGAGSAWSGERLLTELRGGAAREPMQTS